MSGGPPQELKFALGVSACMDSSSSASLCLWQRGSTARMYPVSVSQKDREIGVEPTVVPAADPALQTDIVPKTPDR